MAGAEKPSSSTSEPPVSRARSSAGVGLAEPAIDGDLEAALGALRDAEAELRLEERAQDALVAHEANLLARRQPQPELDERAIQEGHAHLEAVRHRDLVGLHEEVVEQHRVEVDVLEPLHGVEPQRVGVGEHVLVARARAILAVADELAPLVAREDVEPRQVARGLRERDRVGELGGAPREVERAERARRHVRRQIAHVRRARREQRPEVLDDGPQK